MQRADIRLVNVLDAARGAFAPFGGQGFVRRRRFQLVADALAQLRRRRFRESDGRYLVERRRPRLDERHYSGHEACGLPRPRAGFHEQRFAERFGDALARRVVLGDEFAHRAPPLVVAAVIIAIIIPVIAFFPNQIQVSLHRLVPAFAIPLDVASR